MTGQSRPRRPGRWVATAVAVAVVAAPAGVDRDSYPLSTYPVYADARPAVADLATAIGLAADGTWTRLSLPVIGASDDPLIVEQRVSDAIGQGRADALCRAIAERAGPGTPVTAAGTPVVAIQVVTEQVDLVATAASGAPPIERTVHARCPVGR